MLSSITMFLTPSNHLEVFLHTLPSGVNLEMFLANLSSKVRLNQSHSIYSPSKDYFQSML